MAIKEITISDPDVKITWEHKEIRQWIEKHSGKPAVFDDPEAKADKLGIRIDFKGKTDERFMNDAVKTKAVSWDRFFNLFDKRKLAFVYNPKDEPEDLTLAYILIPRKNLPK